MSLGQSPDEPNVAVFDMKHAIWSLGKPVWAKHSTRQWRRGGFGLLKMFSGGQTLCGAELDPFDDAVVVPSVFCLCQRLSWSSWAFCFASCWHTGSVLSVLCFFMVSNHDLHVNIISG